MTIDHITDRIIAPSLVVRGLDQAIAFYVKALGAEVLYRNTRADGIAQHARLRILNSYVTLSEVSSDLGMVDQQDMVTSVRPVPHNVSLELFVDDIDHALQRAVDAGARLTPDPSRAFFGDRTATFSDPFGHSWTLSTFLDDGGALCI
jgi:PhnB protein